MAEENTIKDAELNATSGNYDKLVTLEALEQIGRAHV